MLVHCIESVANQSYPYKEHIIVDGASTDGTVELLRNMSARYPHIRWVSEVDAGLSQALNKGLKLASGNLIGVIGDDDLYEPGAFQVVAEAFRDNPSVGIISGNCQLVDNGGIRGRTLFAAFTNRSELIECWKNWGTRVSIPAPSSFVSAAAIDKVGGFEERDRFAMDYRHWIKLAEFYDVRTVDKVLANFRYDEGNISFSSCAGQWAETLAISREYWGPRFSRSYFKFLSSYLGHLYLFPKTRRITEFVRRRTGAMSMRAHRGNV